MVSTQRLYRQIADQIAELIARGEFPPGSRLPAERVLAQQLGVSRPSVREALIALEIDGLVDVRGGSGIYVRSAQPAGQGVGAEVEPGPFEVVAARLLVEGETAALAASHATALQLARLEETLGLMQDELGAKDSALDADRLFHVRIAEAAGNSALVPMVDGLWDYRKGAMFSKLDEHFDSPERHAAAIEEHRLIIDAIRRRDPEAARAAMRGHLEHVRQTLERGWEDAAGRAAVPAKARGALPADKALSD
jgi:DNA-binding FadR family transcriptional regulator